MSVTGKAAARKILRGKLSNCEVIYVDAYELAVINGFEGTIEEWLESIKGAPGKDYVLTEADKQDIANLVIAKLPVYSGEAEDV